MVPPCRQERDEMHWSLHGNGFLSSRFLVQLLPLYQLHEVGEHKSVVIFKGFVEKQAPGMLCPKHKNHFRDVVWILRAPAQLPCNIIAVFLCFPSPLRICSFSLPDPPLFFVLNQSVPLQHHVTLSMAGLLAKSNL